MATDAIISFAIERLGDLIIQEAKFLFGVRDQVKSLQDELQRMRCFLLDAESKQYESESVRNWISEIREVAYDAEDLLEDFVLKIELKKQGGMKGVIKRVARLPIEGVSLHKIGSNIEEITTRLSKIAAGMRDYGIQESMDKDQPESLQARQREKRQSFPHVIERDLVGLESKTEELVSALVDEEKKLRIVSICGMGGLGKTTLARQIYHHNKVRKHFDGFAWSYISQQCQRRDIWEGILRSLSYKHSTYQIIKWRDQKLVEELHNFLRNNKCLIVLDDIWSSEAWDILKDAFPYESSSRIILTSRNKDVALFADLQGLLHQPECLNDDQSWELLRKIVFPNRNNTEFKIETKMEMLGKQMIKHCAGLPLAIRVLGGLLAKKCTTTQWQMIHENVKSYITGGVGKTSNNSSINGVLSLSYEELSSQLKKCFLYLAQFPEDYEISVDKLLKYWSAEGMIMVTPQGERRTIEDVAECYLDELIERSMVLVGVRDVVSSRVRTCRLHDLMRDLCLLKAEQDNFVRVIDPQLNDLRADSMQSLSTSKFRRVAVHLFRAKDNRFFLQKNIRNSRLRSLIYFNSMAMDSLYWKLLEPDFKYFSFLRVLDLEAADLKEKIVPKDIGKLIHVRFLSFRNAKVSSFPSSLGNLRLMETLDLRVWFAYIPNVLWKMKKLRHLYLPARCDGKTRLKLRNLLELRTLVDFPLGVSDVNDLFSLTKLQTLTIRRTPQMKEIEAPIMPVSISASLGQLESLSLGGSTKLATEANLYPSPPAVDVSSLLSGFTNLLHLNLYMKITRLPNLDMIPSAIVSITLASCQLGEDPMRVLEGLLELRSLSICLEAYTGKVMICRKTGFPKLNSLLIFGMHNLEEWKLEEGGMPCLSMLKIGDCIKLKKLPKALKEIDTLQQFEIFGMPKIFKDGLFPGGCDFYKIQHISSVVFHFCDKDEAALRDGGHDTLQIVGYVRFLS